VGGEAPLGGGRRPDRPKRAAERDEEGVPVGADLDPAGLGDGSPDDRGVLVLDAAYRAPILWSRPVEPSMSVNRNVTVPVGSSVIR
jgi:hypothetical protein